MPSCPAGCCHSMSSNDFIVFVWLDASVWDKVDGFVVCSLFSVLKTHIMRHCVGFSSFSLCFLVFFSINFLSQLYQKRQTSPPPEKRGHGSTGKERSFCCSLKDISGSCFYSLRLLSNSSTGPLRCSLQTPTYLCKYRFCRFFRLGPVGCFFALIFIQACKNILNTVYFELY